jgi:hypothetical protein
VSSTYRILCLSHDPAIDYGEYRSSEDAEDAIADGIPEHARCDLLIGRYSYPLVEVGCPATRHQPAHLRCHHGGTVWVDADWLRLLTAARQSGDEAVQAAASKIRQHCWTSQRLDRLHDELGLDRQEQP